MKKVIICTTFRDFIGGPNDDIQREFLRYINNQEYKNWLLVVTIYKEKNVEKEVLNRIDKSKVIFIYSKLTDCRFSLTEVFLNGINVSKYRNNVVIWVNSDILLEPDFFNILDRCVKGNRVLSVIPNTEYTSLQNYYRNNIYCENPEKGIDILIFSSSFFNQEVKNDIEKYQNKNWGIFEHFLVALGVENKGEMINLYPISRVHKIQNNREANNESNNYFLRSHSQNAVIFEKYLRDHNLTENFFSLFYCFTKFRPIKLYRLYYIKFIKNAWNYYYSIVVGKIGKLYSIINQ